MRRSIRLVLLLVTGLFFLMSLFYAMALSRSELGEVVGPIMHFSLMILVFFVLWFIRPYQRWAWDKLRRQEHTVLFTLLGCAFLSWLLGFAGVPWATVELFFAFGWATFSFGLFAVLLNLPKVKKFNA